MKNTPIERAKPMRRGKRMRQVSGRRQAARDEAPAIWGACWERDGGRCFKCGTPRGKLDAHHRLGGGLGPDSLENRILLCGYGNNPTGPSGEVYCHGFCHTERTEAEANGWVISRHERRPPQQIPARHHDLGLVYLTQGGRMIPVDDVVAWTTDGLLPLTEGDLALEGGHG